MDFKCDELILGKKDADSRALTGVLQAHWGYGSVRHDGERYEVHLCEDCFFTTLAYLRQEHRTSNMFDEGYQPADPDSFGRV